MRRNLPALTRSHLRKVAEDARVAARQGMTKEDCPYFDSDGPFSIRFNEMRAARRAWIAAFEEESANAASGEATND